jgi:tetratricopeptide (TPR) repeat protein
MSTYLGNDTLSPAVKERVTSTFQQTLALYKQGRTDEVVAGCGLILRMDPMFDPAKKLLDKIRNPALPIDVDSLGTAAPIMSTASALEEARSALAGRDFQRAINLTTEILTNDLMNDDARILNEQARDKMEAGPFVEQFARKVEQHLTNKNLAAARTDLEKARALDPDHPALKRTEQMVAAFAAGSTPAAPPPASFGLDSPSFVVENPKPPAAGRGTAQATDFGFTFEEEKPAAPPPAAAPAFGGFSFDAPSAPPPAAAPPPPANPAPFGGGFSFDSPSSPPSSGGDALSNFSFEAPKPAPQPAPPPAAPAAGGFSFDAPPSGGFSFDAPSTFGAPPPAPVTPPDEPRTFDFTTAPSEIAPDDQRKIAQYLAEGDRAAEGSDYQGAIEVWSRIFLIDVTNEGASERIERAKMKRREIESKVETMVSAGIAAFERKDSDAARAKFAEALRADPNNSAAQEYMARLNDAATEGGAVGYEAPYQPPEPKSDLFEDDFGGFESAVPPEPSPAPTAGKGKAAPAEKPKPAKAPSSSRKSAMPMIVIAVVVVVLGAGGWFAYSKFSSKPVFDPAATQLTFKRAEGLAVAGKFDQAISLLQDVKPEDPLHDRAIVMMADLQHRKQQASEMVDGKPAAVYYQENLANGRAAYDGHDYEGAKKAWDNAARVKPLPPEMQTLYATTAQQAAKLDSAKALFKEAKYQDAILNLAPLLLQDPQNLNIQRMISDAHFNLGASALADERLTDAMNEFDEVLKTSPNDDLSKRSRDLAARYAAQPKGTPKDLLYKIYVKYLPIRKVS